ncbi:hypothetical protein HDE76_000027 [Rhodanobacter sp. ANJX3]|uniref:hypothetical protein n=1 Tax=Rhodanobacter sp. ANJX3 TaxID=2723083 RepID=UPI0016194FDE|nr:hypothetical protein [Rhodanobacter sp. ANJX3]MBB5356845.1 hypothetical protein [Rhodanobacter sp. ANJX3]
MSDQGEKKLTMDLVEPIVESETDKIYRVISIGVQAIPLVGGAIGEAFHAFVKSPFERRQRRAIELMMEAINSLQDKVFRSQEDLINDEAFVSTLFTAASMATRTADAEKLRAIKQAVISGALDAAPDEAMQQMFMATLAGMTGVHLKLLPYFKSLTPQIIKGFNAGERSVQNSYFDKVKAYVPKGTDTGLIARVTRDLQSWGVIAVPVGASSSASGPNFITMTLTDFGKRFVEFIDA